MARATATPSTPAVILSGLHQHQDPTSSSTLIVSGRPREQCLSWIWSESSGWLTTCMSRQAVFSKVSSLLDCGRRCSTDVSQPELEDTGTAGLDVRPPPAVPATSFAAAKVETQELGYRRKAARV